MSKQYLIAAYMILFELGVLALFSYATFIKVSDLPKWLFTFANIPYLYDLKLAWVGYLIPVIEAAIVLGFLVDKLRHWILRVLIVLLVVYVLFLLFQLYTPYGTPCACQGIFSFLDLKQHLAGTVIFLAMSILYFFLSSHSGKTDTHTNLQLPS